MKGRYVASSLRGIRVVIGSIGDDIHVVGITILGHALRNAGAEVIQLGIQTPAEEFVATAVAEDADAVFVSSSNGHAAIFCDGIRGLLNKAGAEDILLYAGGNLSVSAAADWTETEARFLAFGFDRAYPSRSQPDTAIDDLAAVAVARVFAVADVGNGEQFRMLPLDGAERFLNDAVLSVSARSDLVFGLGQTEENDAADAERMDFAALANDLVDRHLKVAGHGADLAADAVAGTHEERKDELRGRKPGLAHQVSQGLGGA